MVQWSVLPMQGVQVQSLVMELKHPPLLKKNKKRLSGWALIPYDCVLLKRGYLDREERQCAGRVETALHEPRRGPATDPSLSAKGTNLLTL